MPERATVKSWSEKSAEAAVGVQKSRRAEREGKPTCRLDEQCIRSLGNRGVMKHG